MSSIEERGAVKQTNLFIEILMFTAHLIINYCDFQNAVTPLVHGTQDIMFVKIIRDSNDIVKYNSSS